MSDLIKVSGGDYKFQDVMINGVTTKCLVPIEPPKPAFIKFKAGDRVTLGYSGGLPGVIICTTWDNLFAVINPDSNVVWDAEVNKTSEFLWEKGWRLVK